MFCLGVGRGLEAVWFGAFGFLQWTSWFLDWRFLSLIGFAVVVSFSWLVEGFSKFIVWFVVGICAFAAVVWCVLMVLPWFPVAYGSFGGIWKWCHVLPSWDISWFFEDGFHDFQNCGLGFDKFKCSNGLVALGLTNFPRYFWAASCNFNLLKRVDFFWCFHFFGWLKKQSSIILNFPTKQDYKCFFWTNKNNNLFVQEKTRENHRKPFLFNGPSDSRMRFTP